MNPEKEDFFAELLGWAKLQPATPAITEWIAWASTRKEAA